MPDRLRLVIAPSTADDLERIWAGIAEDNAQAADRIVSGVLVAIDRLRDFLEMGVEIIAQRAAPARKIRFAPVKQFRMVENRYSVVGEQEEPSVGIRPGIDAANLIIGRCRPGRGPRQKDG